MHVAPGAKELRADAAGLAALRERLFAEGYRHATLVERFGALEIPTRRARNLGRLLRATASGGAQDTLVRLLLFGVPVDIAAAREAFAPLDLAAVEEAGLILRAGEMVHATVTLFPYEDLLIAFDKPDQVAAGARPDLVMGVTSSSMDVVYSTIRRPIRQSLDLGCGCGIQALLLARHSELVIATDLNERALVFTQFNAALNGIGNIECRAGSGFAPVAGESFDVMASNLPFVISPSQTYLYRDSGIRLDGFARQIVQSAPPYLSDGGFFQLQCQWVHVAGQAWEDRLRSWFADSGCDVWVLKIETLSPVDYADRWIRDTEQDNLQVARRLFGEWMEYYDREQVEAISAGMVFLRRRSGAAHWFRLDEMPPQPPGPYGDAVLRGFTARDTVDALRSDQALLMARPQMATDVRLFQQSEWRDGSWQMTGAQVRHMGGLRFAGNVDLYIAGLLARCDGTQTVGALLNELARSAGVPVDRIQAGALAMLRGMLERGFLQIPEAGGN